VSVARSDARHEEGHSSACCGWERHRLRHRIHAERPESQLTVAARAEGEHNAAVAEHERVSRAATNCSEAWQQHDITRDTSRGGTRRHEMTRDDTRRHETTRGDGANTISQRYAREVVNGGNATIQLQRRHALDVIFFPERPVWMIHGVRFTSASPRPVAPYSPLPHDHTLPVTVTATCHVSNRNTSQSSAYAPSRTTETIADEQAT
jgi:hypothetical protein